MLKLSCNGKEIKLLITLFTFIGWKLPYIASNQQALLAISILVGLKIVNAVIHYLLSSG